MDTGTARNALIGSLATAGASAAVVAAKLVRCVVDSTPEADCSDTEVVGRRLRGSAAAFGSVVDFGEGTVVEESATEVFGSSVCVSTSSELGGGLAVGVEEAVGATVASLVVSSLVVSSTAGSGVTGAVGVAVGPVVALVDA
ncbi:hypothetical protein TUM20985_57770 [Mycobacterium antarcticum]|uniref:hypothetical protein n=1 Tax=Mycolicibacterium sp. TUM20985 TaxID=3023370 RepID=UPI002572A356|nr:hypothetical protein [Mycolicibacterium sp. TUM20985]BDX35230.1 hypothetical protein TUM20985_57770 [Mycolicibacterium sp. TUM20985]